MNDCECPYMRHGECSNPQCCCELPNHPSLADRQKRHDAEMERGEMEREM